MLKIWQDNDKKRKRNDSEEKEEISTTDYDSILTTKSVIWTPIEAEKPFLRVLELRKHDLGQPLISPTDGTNSPLRVIGFAALIYLNPSKSLKPYCYYYHSYVGFI